MTLKEVMLKQIVIREHNLKGQIDGHKKAVNFIVEEFGDLDREALIVLNLDNSGRPINFQIVSVGALDRSIVEPREVIKNSILSNAKSIIMLHNHPSGSLKVSDADIEATARMMQVCNTLNIQFNDHIIMTPARESVSMLSNGYLTKLTARINTINSYNLNVMETSPEYTDKFKEEIKEGFNKLSLRDRFEIVLQGERSEYANADQETIDKLYEAFENNDEMLGLMNSNDIDSLENMISLNFKKETEISRNGFKDKLSVAKEKANDHNKDLDSKENKSNDLDR